MSLKSKPILIVILLLLMNSAFAEMSEARYRAVAYKDDTVLKKCAPGLLGGFYVGAQLGYDVYDADLKIAGVGGNGAEIDLNAKGWASGILFGYGRYVDNRLYLGGEVFVNPTGISQGVNQSLASINGTAGTYHGRYSTFGNYGFALFPGIKLTDPTMIFLHLGFNRARLKYLETATGLGSASDTVNKSGFVYGGGIETLLINKWSLRAEYTYTDYKEFSTHITPTSTTKIRSADNQFMLAVLYHFY